MTSEQHRYFDSYTEPLDVLADTAPEDRLRDYDMENETILFRGEAYELGPGLSRRRGAPGQGGSGDAEAPVRHLINDVAKDIVEKAYERREESRQRLQDGSGATAGLTNFRAEGLSSARPLRREE